MKDKTGKPTYAELEESNARLRRIVLKLKEELHYYKSESDKGPPNFKFIQKRVYTDEELEGI